MSSLLHFLVIGSILFQFLMPPALSPSPKAFDPLIYQILSESDPARWLDWIAALSGEVPIQTEKGEEKILTRSSFALFEPTYSPSAFNYLEDQLISLGFERDRDYQIHTYAFPYGENHPERNWKNLILTFEGVDPDLKNERVLMVAHLDSTSDQELVLAPGADDNASGSAGLLEAAELFRHYQFNRTINLVWFSGEEQSRLGSEYFVRDYADWMPNITGVINLDMFAFDWDNDRCFEIHAGFLPGSQLIARTFEDIINLYGLNLRFDLVDDEYAYPFSDHKAFWDHSVPAVMIFENGFYQPQGVCGIVDRNTTYHSTADTLAYINRDTGYSILQAAIGTAAQMAAPAGECFSDSLQFDNFSVWKLNALVWRPLNEAESYLIWRYIESKWEFLGESDSARWPLQADLNDEDPLFLIAARSTEGCQSQPFAYSIVDNPPIIFHNQNLVAPERN